MNTEMFTEKAQEMISHSNTPERATALMNAFDHAQYKMSENDWNCDQAMDFMEYVSNPYRYPLPAPDPEFINELYKEASDLIQKVESFLASYQFYFEQFGIPTEGDLFSATGHLEDMMLGGYE